MSNDTSRAGAVRTAPGNTARGHAASAALLAALVPLGTLMPLADAKAGIDGDLFGPTSRVDAVVNDESTATENVFEYLFTITNTSQPSPDEEIECSGFCGSGPILVDWELPLFSLDDIDVGSIQTPQGWAVEILDGRDDSSEFYNNPNGPYGPYMWNYDPADDPLLDGNPNLYGPNPEVFQTPPHIIHWYVDQVFSDGSPANGLLAGDSQSGFGFESAFGDQNAPYLASWFFEPPVSGDPPIPDDTGNLNTFGTPLSPARIQAQNFQPPVDGVPAPGVLVLLLTGLAGLFGSRRRALRTR